MPENRLMYRRPKTQRKTLRIIEMHLGEKSPNQIAATTGLSRSTVRRVISDIMDNQQYGAKAN